MTVLTEIYLALAIIIFIAWWLHQLNKDKKFYQNIPGPPGVPLLGNALDFQHTSQILKNLCKYINDHGETFKGTIGLRRFIAVSDYKFLECILSSTKLLKKSVDYYFLQPWLGTGLLTADGRKWSIHRQILTPAFHFQILEQFIDVFESCGKKFVQKLEKEVGKDSVDVYPLVTLCSLDIICESVVGISVNAQDDENSDYVRSVKEMCRIVTERSISPIQMFDLLFPLSKNYYTQKKALRILHHQTNSVITQRRKELESKVEESSGRENGVVKKKKIFLDLLLEARIDGKPLTQEEIREEVDTFMFEGHDTTSSAISFTLFCLANHPDIQQRAFEEQQALFGDDKNPNVTLTDLKNMKYLELVIKETLRLYPSVPLYCRETNKEVEYGDTALPEGDTILIFAYGIHRNPKYFKDPEKFDPSRFENIDGKLPYAYIPFSAGPRNCIGQKFAMLELKSTVSRVLRRFELQPAFPQHTLQLVAEVILKSRNGIKISLKLR